MKETFYRKVGRRYIPVYEYDQTLMDSFPKGSHLVITYPGGQSRRFNIDPNHAALIAAGRVAEDAMCDAIRKASEMRPPRAQMTQQQRDAWEDLIVVFGDEARSLSTNSARDVAEAGLKALEAEADKLMKHASVQHAYEQFLLVCKLAKETECQQ